MCIDNDIKIAGDKPSLEIKKQKESQKTLSVDAGLKAKAMQIGKEVAQLFAEDAKNSDIGDMQNSSEELVMQRRLLLSLFLCCSSSVLFSALFVPLKERLSLPRQKNMCRSL